MPSCPVPPPFCLTMPMFLLWAFSHMATNEPSNQQMGSSEGALIKIWERNEMTVAQNATHMWGFQHLIEDVLNVRKFYAWPTCWNKTISKWVLKCPLCKIKFSQRVKDPSDAEWMVELWRCFTANRSAAKSPLFQDWEVDHNPWKYCVVFGNFTADFSDSKNTRFCSASQRSEKPANVKK